MVTSLAHQLVAEGIETIVLASRSYHEKGKSRLPARETISGINVHRLSTSGFGRNTLLGRAIDYATFHLAAATGSPPMPGKMIFVSCVPIRRFSLFRPFCRSACGVPIL